MVKSPTPVAPDGAQPSTPDGAQSTVLPRLDHSDRQLALLLSAVMLGFYLRTLAPGLLPGDAGEFQFAAWRLGLAHPTGYPLYLLLGWGWQHLLALVGISPATAMNSLSALFGAAGVGLLYLLMVRWTPGAPALRRVVGVYSAVLLGINFTYWSQALIAEVYTLHVVLVLLLLLATQNLAHAPAPRHLLAVALLAGLALTHHALSLLLLPALALYLLLTWTRADWQRLSLGSWLLALFVGLLPLLLYLYIPLRSGPDASPWYHQSLGAATLTLYEPSWPAFWRFVSGQSIAVGFRNGADGLAQLPTAVWLWHYHFGWVGLLLMALGLFWLARTRRTAILIATLAYVLLQQSFNLFYNIGDILVYYIPLYLIGAIWAGFGLAGVVTGQWQAAPPAPETQRATGKLGGLTLVGWLAAALLLLVALRAGVSTLSQIDQSASRTARRQWEAILAANPPANAILVSNDRNEIVPLFYLQSVEDRAVGITGLFPGIAPDVRFANLGATLDTALAAGNRAGNGAPAPIYLIKPMPGLEVKYDLAPATAPLVQVRGLLTPTLPTVMVDQPYGPLTLLGYDWASVEPSAGTGEEGARQLALYWRVDAPVEGDYTVTVQLLDADARKLAQDDQLAGGVYYPTGLWQPGETLVTRHALLPTDPLPAQVTLLVSMYRGPELTPLAPALRLPLAQ